MAPPNVKIKHLIRSSSGNSRFPKLDECAHFHYENVELGPIKVVLCDKQTESNKLPPNSNSSPNKENEVDHFCFLVLVVSNGRKWVVRRTYNDFVFLDTQLHRCVYDRKYSLLRELPNVTQEDLEDGNPEERIRASLTEYLERFSQLAGSLITCGPVLNWLELDNRGNRLIVTDEVAINTPAVAAAYVIVHYTAQAADEISFDVGDMISVIDMPPPDESTWWRGKRGFEVGFFPSECVEVIGDKVPRGFKLSNASTKPVFRKHGKLIAFFRSFLLSRPSRRKLKQSGILKERVFGCDLGEHLLNTKREIPLVLKCCTEFIEEHGVVDGIYRLSGVSSNIQRLRNAFDEDCATNLGDPTIAQDIHSVASLLKMYFRELPNPLLTYQLYDKFVSAVQSSEDMRLLRIREVVQQLPPPHYRTLQYLLSHLARVASYGEQTGMTPKNIAIVWAPNLLRSRDVENGGVGALHVVGVQAVLTEYLIRYSDLIFDEKSSFPAIDQEDSSTLKARPKSLAISTPTKLLSLEEARARALSTHLPLTQQKYIDVGGGPEKLPSKYHTVISLPPGKQGCPKLKKSPSGWKSFFSRGWYSGSTRDKSRPSFRSSRKSSTASLPHTSTQMQEKASTSADASYHRKKLRTVKSAESLIHCSKDTSPDASDAMPKPVGSHHSTPEASMDFSFEATSNLSKSPSLQKHTRSSSHESYFDNGIDMISDPPVEDEDEEHSLFYYVSREMEKMQESSPSWQTDHVAAFASYHDSSGCLLGSLAQSKAHELSPQKIPSEGTEDTRKQKLDTSGELAQPKIQRLSWMENNVSGNMLPMAAESSPPSEDMVDAEEHKKYINFRSSAEDCSFWLPRSDQSMFCKLSGNHEEGYQLDPFAFYDCAVDKRASCISSSDETESGNRTIVERYGNAETVLVEVHATQDSSSEGEQELSKFIQHFEPVEGSSSPIGSLAQNKFCSLEYIPPVNVSPSHSECSIPSPQNESEHILNEVISKVSDLAENNAPPDSESSCVTFAEMANSLLDVQSEDNAGLESSSDTDAKGVVSIDSAVNVLEGDSPVPVTPVQICKDVDAQEIELDPSDILSSGSLEPLSLSAEMTEPQTCDTDKEFKVKTPPSPVYPAKPPKSLEFFSFQSKVENITYPKRRQVFSIPSPSSPVEEVRKKFELQASSIEKSKDSSYRASLPSCAKDTASKLSDKQRHMFEVQERSPSEEGNRVSKRKSDVSSPCAKTDRLLSKRHSEPLTPVSDISPGEQNRSIARNVGNLSTNFAEGIDPKTKASTPSLFTQLKIRKLQSLQGSASMSSKSVDPWSDPILDIQEEYHPLVSYPQFTRLPESDKDEEVSLSMGENASSTPQISTDKSKEETPITMEESKTFTDVSVDSDISDKTEVQPKEDVKDSGSEPTSNNSESSELLKFSSAKACEGVVESETIKRERINRIKEERRAQLREKLKPESFRLETEEKEKVQSKFRSRKELCRHSLDASVDDDAKHQNSDSLPVCDSKADLPDQTVKSSNCDANNISIAQQGDNAQTLANQLNSTVSRVSSAPPVELRKAGAGEPRSNAYRRSTVPGDIRERVAMFERSKDSTESCRLGPNNKFPPKQGTTTSLTPSYVR